MSDKPDNDDNPSQSAIAALRELKEFFGTDTATEALNQALALAKLDEERSDPNTVH